MMDKKSDASAQDIQMELSEIERDLTLRGLLWQSLVEWAHLVDEWTATAFDSVNVESLQKNVNKLTQTVYMLEKGKYMFMCADEYRQSTNAWIIDICICTCTMMEVSTKESNANSASLFRLFIFTEQVFLHSY